MLSIRIVLALAAVLMAQFPLCGSAVASQNLASEHQLSPEITVHYYRPDQNYEGWNLWVWAENQPGSRVDFYALTPPEGTTTFGVVATIPVTDPSVRIGFIVRKGEWSEKDIDHDRYIDPATQSGVYLVAGDPTVFTSPKQIDLTLRITGAFLDSSTQVTFGSTVRLTKNQRLHTALKTPAGLIALDSISQAKANSGTRLVYTATLSEPIDPAAIASLSLVVPGSNTELDPITVYARDVLDDPEFIPSPDIPLGPSYSADHTVFRTWSPVSTSVELLLFDDKESPNEPRVIALAAEGYGLWETRIEGDLHGTLYQYRFTSYGVDRVAPDIHTFAATGDSAFSVVVDLDRLEPEGWDEDSPPTIESQIDEVIYEIHVRDYSITDPTCPEEHRGTYLGLTNPGDKSVIPTGIRHLTGLGITAVHLMPIQDYTAPRGQYNWGYWTALFNVPESNYATSDKPGQATLELRTAILALHSAGVRVILDVVYNHTSTSLDDSPFHSTVPYYYHRTTPDGRLLNGSGTGNAFADERTMAREYIADSLEFWTTQYDVDGFRFDLLGMHLPESVLYWTTRLKELRPDITLYGEPWTGGGTTHFPKGAQRGQPIAVFNDHLRNAIRGDLDGTAQGFATGPGGDRDSIKLGVMGAIDDFADEPNETITYVSAHDNLTLWDKITLSNPTANDSLKQSMQRLALGVVLTSQGAVFLHGGSDFARTKQGNHNSYESGDDINQFDWRRKWDFKGLHNYTRGLIAIRNQHPAFRMRTAAQIRENLVFLDSEKNTPLAFTLNGAAVGDSWSTILVAYNPHPFNSRLVLPDDGEWNIAADYDRAATISIGTVSGFHVMKPYSVTVLFRD